MPALVEPLGDGQARGTGADDRHPLVGARLRRRGRHAPGGKRALDRIQLVVPHGDGIGAYAAQARLFAQRRAHAAGELGKIVGL